MQRSWKKESDWKSYHRKMSTKELIKSVNAHKRNPTFYRGTVLPKVAREELARRKKAGLARKDAGTKKRTSSDGFGSLFSGSRKKVSFGW